jgi:hypothetical protein
MYTAIIIEPRRHPALAFVLNNFNENLSEEWKIRILCGNGNKDVCDEIVKTMPRADVVQLNVDNFTSAEYSKFCASEEFHAHVPTETFLVFQTDTLILNKDKLNKFLTYDYVGAPWAARCHKVGNGGLSIRKKSKMLEIIKATPYQRGNEDVYFVDQTAVQLNTPSGSEAMEFSVETIYHPEPFGVHGISNRHDIFNKLAGDYPLLNEWKRLQ